MKMAFVLFLVTSSWTLLSILTAVVSDNMLSTTGAQEKELKIESADEDRQAHIAELEKLFSSIDVSGDGNVLGRELQEFLADKDNARKCATCCRVPVREVVEVFETLSWNGGEGVNMKDFVDV